MKLTIREMAVFSMMGALMYASKLVLDWAPNIHLLGMFTVAFTVVYRRKALYPIYIFVLLLGVLNGFATWWIPYLYIWTVLWGAVMLIPQKLPKRVRMVLYILACAAHGFLYGTLYAPVQALLFGFNFETTIAWIIAGLPWDVMHGVSNLVCGFLIMPLVAVLEKMEQSARSNI